MATCVRFAAPVLAKMARTWLAAVFSVIRSREAICRLLAPSASSRSTAVSRAVSPAGVAEGRSSSRSSRRSTRTCPVLSASRRASVIISAARERADGSRGPRDIRCAAHAVSVDARWMMDPNPAAWASAAANSRSADPVSPRLESSAAR